MKSSSQEDVHEITFEGGTSERFHLLWLVGLELLQEKVHGKESLLRAHARLEQVTAVFIE